MGWEAWLTVATVALTMALLVRNYAPDLIMLGGVTFLATVQAITGSKQLPSINEAFGAFGNEGLLSVAVLFVVVAGLSQTGAMSLISRPLLGRPTTMLSAQVRLMFPVGFLSAFLNNTPIVAMFMPVVSDWCKKNNLSPSKLFIPLSYATILGGACTLIGTSTNLVVNALWIQSGREPLGMFSITPLGIVVALVGIGYLILAGRKLLPDRIPPLAMGDDPRKYSVEMVVERGSALRGRSIQEAGLRNLPGLFLAEIERDGRIIAAVSNEERLKDDDRLVFVGVVESVIDLQHIRGLKPATDQVFKLDVPRADRVLVEAVVSNSSPLLGKTIREGKFRSIYHAAIIAVARNGEQLRQKIGDIELAAGDTLLLETQPSFIDQQRNSRDFLLVSRVDGAVPPRHEQGAKALGILAMMVFVVGMEWLSVLNAALIAAGFMRLARCISGTEARRSVDWQVILAIGGSLGIGQALAVSGAAKAIADNFIGLAGSDPLLALAAVYGLTILFTELMSNNAAAALTFPIAIATATQLGASPIPFVMTIMVAASCGFATPMGYQTHLMVYGPGGYRFSDFLRIGVPLDILCGIVTIIVAPIVWPFYPR